MARLAVLVSDARAMARLVAALDGQHQLVACQDLECFWEVVDSCPVDGCVVDIYDASHRLSFLELQRLRRRMPPLAIVVYSDFQDREMDLFELGRLKIDGVILAGTTDHGAETRKAVAEALATAGALGVMTALDGQLHPLGMECLRWSIERAEEAPGVGDLAEALALTPATLARELRDRGLPSAARFLLWGRLFRAARMMVHPEHGVEGTAFRLGYSSASALGRALRRGTGLSPTDLMRRGGVACVLDRFLRRELHGRTG